MGPVALYWLRRDADAVRQRRNRFHDRPKQHTKTYDLVQTPKNLCYLPQLKHGHIFDRPAAIEVFVEQQLNGGTPLARISVPEVNNIQVTASVDTTAELVSAARGSAFD